MSELELTTDDEIEVLALVANNDYWVELPSIIHPLKRRIHRNLASRALEATDVSDPTALTTFSLTAAERGILVSGVLKMADALLEFNDSVAYSTNTMNRDATALKLAAEFRV